MRALFDSGLGLLQTRLQLLVVELEEEKLRILGMLGYGAAALLLLSAGLVFLAIFLTVLLWDAYRLLVLGLFTVVFLGAGGLALAAALRHARADGGLFSGSLAELAKDREKVRGEPREPR